MEPGCEFLCKFCTQRAECMAGGMVPRVQAEECQSFVMRPSMTNTENILREISAVFAEIYRELARDEEA